ncbi:SAICAR synthase-like protein [Patellaria atrata CBS 101060]|uniref:Kinase n=1 Tax=Patellaria atrata CBS 101060 TaxID=1346257 RepID=A0A9P4S9V6_9PEZI|nr:SAICAR synthase-like protein [Patellaria atrata CBS 101060]
MSSKLDPSKLQAFGNAAAGHDGVLSDDTGSFIIKPCTQAEIEFYGTAIASHPRFAAHMPQFYGTLALNDASQSAVTADPEAAAQAALEVATSSTFEDTPLKGKKLSTEISIVLEDITASFTKPNVLDIKLGAQLWDEQASLDKREKLDKVSRETTSSSLGFRIAGMKVWKGASPAAGSDDKPGYQYTELDTSKNYRSYNKMYGRTFTVDNITKAFKEFLCVPGAGITPAKSADLIKRFSAAISDIQVVLEEEESRMYSASLLFAYEGDGEAYDAAVEEEERALEEDYTEKEMAEEDDEDDTPKVAIVKLIDFAHARFEKGLGPDENTLRGVRNVLKVLQVLGKLGEDIA